MKKVVTRNRVLAFVLILLVVCSSFVNTVTVFGNEEGILDILKKVVIVNKEAIGATIDDKAYVKYGENIGLDFSSCDFEDDTKLKVKTQSGTELSVSDGTITLPKEEGSFFIDVLQGEEISTYSLYDVIGIKEFFFDIEKMNINSVKVSNVFLSTTESVWLSEENCPIEVKTSFDTSSLSVARISISGQNYDLSVSDTNTLTLDNDSFTKKLKSATDFTIYFKNNYGTEFSEVYLYQYDSAKPYLDNIDIKGKTSEGENVLYVAKDTSVSADVISKSGVSSLSILKDDVVVSNSFPVTLEDGIYSVNVTSNAGKTADISLFGGKQVKVIKTSPVFDYARYDDTAVDYNSWYNTNGVLELVFKDELGILAGSESLTVNDKKVEFNKKAESDKNTCYYTINTNNFTPVANGLYKIVFKLSDLVGNETTYKETIKIDTVKADYNGIKVDNIIKDADTYYIPDVIKLGGNFNDEASGIASILYKSSINEEYSTISLPCSVDTDGFLKVIDGAGNEQEYSVDALLILAGYSPYVVDKDIPTIDRVSLKEDFLSDNTQFFSKVPEITYNVKDSNTKSVDFYINGLLQESTYNETGTYKFTPNGITDGKIDVEVVVTDKANHSAKDIYSFVVDTQAPENINVSINKPANQKKGNIYFNSDIELSISADDANSFVSEYYLNDKKSTDGKFSITADGNYSVKVVDKLGNVSDTFTLKDLLDWSGNNIIIDKTKPTISTSRPNGESSRKPDWYAKDVVYNFRAEDNLGINSAIVKVNGIIIDNISIDETNAKSLDLKVDTSKIKSSDGMYNIEVYLEDNSTLFTSYKDTIYVDTDAPTNVQVDVPNPVNQKGDKVYYNSDFNVNISANDSGSGIFKYYLSSKNNGSGSFTISSDGEYTVYVEDMVGNKTAVKKLSTLAKWKGNDVVIDSSKPTISTSRPAGESTKKKNWFGNDITYAISLADNKGIDYAYVTINDKEVGSFSTDTTDTKSATLSANTSKVKPNDDGSYNIYVYVRDNAKLIKEWTDTIYIDKTKPSITNFVLNGTVKTKGDTINGSTDKYGFFFDGKGSVRVDAEDKGFSSGIDSIYIKLGNNDWKKHNTNGGNYVTVSVPTKFKGFIEAYVVDNVTHKSKTEMPDGLVSEGSNTHLNYAGIGISLPKTSTYDANGLPLYNKDFKPLVSVKCGWSGINKVNWGINSNTLGIITDFKNVSSWDKNLPLSYDTYLSANGNSNSMELWVKTWDNTNQTSTNSKKFSIDKDKPEINVTYNSNNRDNYYNSNRVANIKVKERNFDGSKFVVSGTSGILGSWSKNGDEWSNTITFNRDGNYNFSINCTDRAGNKADTYSSGSFTIDKTAPVLNVTWSSNNPKNEKYYNKTRTAYISVVEKNFDVSLLHINGASFSGWSTTGDTHTTSIAFKDGSYNFSISGKDLAGNNLSSNYSSGNFVVDTSEPSILIQGISDGVSYKKDVNIMVDTKDINLDSSKVKVFLEGKNHKKKELEGVFNKDTYSFRFDNFSKSKDVDDVYTLIVSTIDLAGNSKTDTVTFSVNRFGSMYSLLNKGLVGAFLKTAKDVKISEVNVDKLVVSKVKAVVTLDGRELSNVEKYFKIVEVEKEGKYVYTYIFDKELFTKDGKYAIQIYSESMDGTEYTSVSEQYEFVIDNKKPEILVSGVESGKQYRVYSKEITIDVRDTSGASDIKVLLNGEKVNARYSNNMYELVLEEESFPQNLEISVTDGAGNENTLKIEDFVISTSIWVYLWNQLWFKALIGLVGLGIILLIVILIARKKKDTKEEEKLAKENERYYRSSGSGGSSSNGNDDSNKDSTVFSDVNDDSRTDIVNTSDDSKTDLL